MKPKVKITYENPAEIIPYLKDKHVLIGSSDKPPQKAILIAPDTPRLRWWQFWRWLDAKKISERRQKEFDNNFRKHFGVPS
jgi:hypothetical protein